jgi:uncharacterized protein (UPF0332 family)
MNDQVLAYWRSAQQALATARRLVEFDPSAAASRAYYAAFYAVSGAFSAAGKSFSKHSAVEDAVHRDFVNTGVWPAERGRDFSLLRGLRKRGDYVVLEIISTKEAAEAVAAAERLLKAVSELDPASFSLDAR